MSKIIHKILVVLLAVSTLLSASAAASAQRMTTAQEGKKTGSVGSSSVSGPDGRVSLKLERGGHVAVDNRTTGRIRVIGWDGDTIEASATSERGAEAVRFSVKQSNDQFVSLKADYLKRPEDETPAANSPDAPAPTATAPTITPPTGMTAESPKQIRIPWLSKPDGDMSPPTRDGKPIEVHLEVRVPRYAEIELIKVFRSHVEVTGVETPIIVLGDRSDVVLKGVGRAEVRTRSGSVEIEDVAGYAEVITASGTVRVRRAQGDVRVLSISGNIHIECVRGRVNVDTADGSIVLADIQGDVDANASNSNVLFTGAIREDGRYHLKTMSGAVEMALRDKPPGFTAALSSYRGTIENDFQLQVKRTIEPDDASINRRIVGNYGDGQAQITLDSFDGKVKLAKTSAGAVKECKMQN